MFDVVIIGSGLGGLLCGYILSKEGYKVCVVEKNAQIGGCLQTFVRDKCIFDTGMHYLGGLDKGQILYRLFKYFRLIDKLKLKKLNEIFDIINISGQEYQYAQGFENFIDTMSISFPSERNNIINYIQKIKEIGLNVEEYLKGNEPGNNQGIVNYDYFGINTNQYLESITQNRKLIHALAGLNGLYSGNKYKSPLYVHAIINYMLISSAWRFVDGGSQIANILANSIKQQGGKIIKQHEVIHFEMFENKNRIKNIVCKNGEKIEGKYFISDVHPVQTFKMLDSGLLRKAYINRINSLQQTGAFFTVYIVLNKNSFKYLNYNYYKFNKDVWVENPGYQSKWPHGYMMYTPANSHADIFADSIIALTYMDYADLKSWENTLVEHRGKTYKDFKKRKAELLIHELNKDFPGLKKNIKTYYTSTPLSYRDYTGTLNGAAYGIAKDYNNPLKTIISPKTKIQNLFLTGQNINLHGVLGVSIGSLLTCAEFLGLKYILNKIHESN